MLLSLNVVTSEMSETSDGSESRLVELKARVKNLDSARKQLASLKARCIGTFHQIDTYFDVPKGRLKLREVEGQEEVELVYYEREDISGPKRSNVFILGIRNSGTFKALFEKVLEKKVKVDKTREIYRHKGTQIHLDTVQGLGEFVEFERKTRGSAEDISKDKKVLKDLMTKFGIQKEDLIKESYSDLLSSGEKRT